MAAKRTTMQDIANACGLSRNTVSKVFNGRGAVPETTRRMILAKAQELNYRQLPADTAPAGRPASRSIAVFTTDIPSSLHYGSTFISAFANQLARAGYNLMMYEVSCGEVRQKSLPDSFLLEQTAGILGIELFDPGYSDLLCSLGLPTIFADTYACVDFSRMGADVISMENTTSVMSVVSRLIADGVKRFGFVGDFEHCNSFYERWTGFCTTLDRAGLPLDRALCILADDEEPYDNTAWLVERLDKMPSMPEVFICANDYLAIHLMRALRRKDVRIPEDVMLVGFDNSRESAVVEPPLTTVQIPSSAMGAAAAGMLLERISDPELPFRRTYLQTAPIWRKTTRISETDQP